MRLEAHRSRLAMPIDQAITVLNEPTYSKCMYCYRADPKSFAASMALSSYQMMFAEAFQEGKPLAAIAHTCRRLHT